MINQNNLNFNTFPQKKKFWWWFLSIALVLLLAFIFWPAGDLPVNNLASKNVRVDENLLYSQSKNEPHQGDISAKARIVEFGDFECPYCEQSFSIVREILQEYQGKIYFVFRDFPLTDLHDHALRSAEAANCAFEQGKFWEMHDRLFTNQAKLEDVDLQKYAQSIGLKMPQFNSCFNGHKYLSKINHDLDDGIGFGVKATPTFFINGYKIEGVIPKDLFMQFINKALAE